MTEARSPADLSIDRLDVIAPGAFAAAVAPLFEGARLFLGRLAMARPFGSVEELFARAREIAHAMPLDEKIELIDAHPRLGAPPADVSALSFVEQGYHRDATEREAEAAAAEQPERPRTRRRRAGPPECRLRGPSRFPLLRLRRRPVTRRAAPRDDRRARRRTATPRSSGRLMLSSTSPATGMRP